MVLVTPVQPSVSLGAHFNLVSLARLGATGGQRAHLLRFLQDPGPCATEGTQSWEASPSCEKGGGVLCLRQD